jgi:hypothetical protein
MLAWSAEWLPSARNWWCNTHQTHATHQQIKRVLKKVYAVELAKDDEHTGTAVFVQGVELRLRTMDLQEAYQKRVTKIKLTVQVNSFLSKLACVFIN